MTIQDRVRNSKTPILDFEYEDLYAYSIGCKTEKEVEEWLENNDVCIDCYERYEITFDDWISVAYSLFPFTHLERSPLTGKLRAGYAFHSENPSESGYIIFQQLKDEEEEGQ